MLDSRARGRGFQPHRRHNVVSFSKNINPSLVLVQPRKTLPYITERLLMGCKELNQTNKIFFLTVKGLKKNTLEAHVNTDGSHQPGHPCRDDPDPHQTCQYPVKGTSWYVHWGRLIRVLEGHSMGSRVRTGLKST